MSGRIIDLSQRRALRSRQHETLELSMRLLAADGVIAIASAAQTFLWLGFDSHPGLERVSRDLCRVLRQSLEYLALERGMPPPLLPALGEDEEGWPDIRFLDGSGTVDAASFARFAALHHHTHATCVADLTAQMRASGLAPELPDGDGEAWSDENRFTALAWIRFLDQSNDPHGIDHTFDEFDRLLTKAPVAALDRGANGKR